MASAQARDSELEARLWKEIGKGETVMLGLTEAAGDHMQPMTAFCDEDAPGTVWFYLRKDNDLLKRAGARAKAMFNLMKGQSFIACVAGSVTEDHDPERIRKFWNPVVAAWYPEGKDDPMLTLLRFDAEDAQLWVSHGNPVRFGWEITKANLTRTLPDVGESRHIDL